MRREARFEIRREPRFEIRRALMAATTLVMIASQWNQLAKLVLRYS